MVVLVAFGMYEHPYALVSFGLCMFVTATIVIGVLEGRVGHSAPRTASA